MVEEPEETGPLTAAEKVAQAMRDGGSVWWTQDGECLKWELDVEIDDPDGVVGLARRSVKDGRTERTITYRLSVSETGAISALGPSMTTTNSLGKTTTGGAATCSNSFASVADIDGGVRLTSRAEGGDQVLDERWYFTAEACTAGRGAKVTSGCGR